MAGHLRRTLLVSADEEDVQTTVWVVDVYLVELAWGGPEEGGWWYQAGQLCRDASVLDAIPPSGLGRIGYFRDEEAAQESATHVQDLLDASANVGRPALSSVLSGGRYVARVTPNSPELGFPAVRPHYE